MDEEEIFGAFFRLEKPQASRYPELVILHALVSNSSDKECISEHAKQQENEHFY